MTNDPVHKDHGIWWFWDETWTFRYGGYATEKEARKACIEYARRLDGNENE